MDLEGEPANDLEISIKSIMASSNEPQSSLVCRKAKQECKAWLPSLDCDDEGRFKVYGVPRGHGFRIEVKGDDRFAPQGLALNTGEPEERGESDATYRDLVKNVKPDEEAVFTLEPAKIFKGRVIFADTGKPVPSTKVSVWASQQEMGSMFVKSGKTNEAGEFKLRPSPGIRFGLSAFAPDGTPYFGVAMPPVEWTGGDKEKTIDVKLKRGVLVSGIVKNEETGEPVVGAPIQYHPLGADSSNISGDIITGWEAIQKTDKDGRFKIAVLPGTGHLLVHGGKNSNFVLKTFGSEELYTGKTGGSRSYTHALVKVNPKDKSETVELDPIELKPGKTVLGTVEDEEGNPVDFFAYSTNKIFPTAFNWRPLVNKSFDGKLELEGLDDRTHTVHLIDTDNGLGATLKVKAGDRPKVVMKPLLPAKVTFVDKKTGEPLKGHHSLYFLQMIAPVDAEGNEDQRFAALKKEKVFPANMDRRRHPMDLKSNDQGEYTIPALIPGATYSVVSYENDKEVVLKTFIASTETTDLGKIETSKFEP